MKKILFITFLILMNISLFGQGENNDYDIDSEDLKSVFEGQGIHIFKYPFDLKKGEYISISYEIFENEKLTVKKHLIEDFQIDNEIKFNHHIARQDTTIFHRFYFFEKNDILTMRQTLPGIKPVEKIDISKIVTGSFNSKINIPTDLTKKEEILFYYGNKSKGWLDCSSGIAKTDLIKRYDFVILFYAEKIKKERTKTILEELKK
ncbi:hypothetical protein [Polaribacter sp. AHE13PA]|uniref:hypothetical protein n=1 Tax=Polaribacter sp. AHE13PA TaxID=2745562 RepID=UPI001C4E904B|nr:hypothetical protein [Polaribacter sp. AHE13PA]QXP68468.1 hypothetical protein H0I28_08235 [Polaribacter sp. AHE13PA]